MMRLRMLSWLRGALAGLGLMAGSAAGFGCAHALAASPSFLEPSLAELVGAERGPGSLHTLALAMADMGLQEILAGDGPFTLFAPTEEAFARISTEQLLDWLAHPARFRTILMQHLVLGRVDSEDLRELPYATTLRGGSVSIHANGEIHVGAARVLETDLQARNGVVHTIDRLILPQ